jgi:hypothetical protein
MKEEELVIQKLKEIQERLQKHEFDIEEAHIKADKILCSFLKELGYEKVVKEYEKIPKWYA